MLKQLTRYLENLEFFYEGRYLKIIADNCVVSYVRSGC